MKVCILSTYEEHGAFNVVATLDRNMIVPLIKERFTDFEGEAMDEAVATATELLRVADPDGTWLYVRSKQSVGRHSTTRRQS